MAENDTTTNSFDLIVIGGGPAGVTAALRARELGSSVALVERGRLGGTCTLDGCVPTRVLAHTARLLRDVEQCEEYGLTGPKPTLDFSQLIAKTQQVVYKIEEKKQLIRHLEASGVTVFTGIGPARFVDPHSISLPDGTRLQAGRFVIAVGGRPRHLEFPGAQYAITHSDVWGLQELPESLAIVGAAATGCQLASIFNAFGTQVALFDISDNILPGEDQSLRAGMASAFNRRWIDIFPGIDGVNRIEKGDKKLRMVYSSGGETKTINVEMVILAVGWPGNLADLNLAGAGVESDGGYIPVNVMLQTNIPHIYAAGDITGKMMLVQSASYEARVAVENAVLGENQAYAHKVVPHGGFTDPEYGSVGMTEEQACERHNCLSATIPYSDLDRAVIDGRPDGFCKLIVSRDTHRILGAHVMGEQALEVIQVIAAGMTAGVNVDHFAELELAYPTYASIVGLAARKLAHELGTVPKAAQWQALAKSHVSEWERSDRET
ncbi:MAG: NAD(P)/FAD-dependent oxidoreductase [Anaerolineales bacterium]|nr:NAD(P)/FAD-dependent oxidoreductase [Anaerolineales bacterium]